MAAVFTLLPVSGCMIEGWWAQLPRPSFRRHFGSTIPRSVVIHEKWGYTALSGSSEYILFSIAPQELDGLIAHRQLAAVELGGESAGCHGTNLVIQRSFLERDIATARAHDLNPSEAFAESVYDGMVYGLLLIDTNGPRALWHYYKL